jgi:hypothetical protein
MFRTRKRKNQSLEELVAETQRLRNELLRTTVRLELFAAQLTVQAIHLRNAAEGGSNERTAEGTDGMGVPPSGGTPEEDSGAAS